MGPRLERDWNLLDGYNSAFVKMWDIQAVWYYYYSWTSLSKKDLHLCTVYVRWMFKAWFFQPRLSSHNLSFTKSEYITQAVTFSFPVSVVYTWIMSGTMTPLLVTKELAFYDLDFPREAHIIMVTVTGFEHIVFILCV